MKEKAEEILKLLEKSLQELQSAGNDVRYASSYARNSASTTYCSHASSSLNKVEQNLIKIIEFVLAENKEQDKNTQTQEFTK